jgi:hypothetical protein
VACVASTRPVPSATVLVFEHGDGGIEDLRRFARTLIIPGFQPLDMVLEYVRDWVDDGGQISLAEAEAATRELWNARLAEQAQWTETGDYDRLLRAYADLDRQGILGRMNFACCRNCATAEIDFERTLHPDPPDWYRYREWGYVYFHQQDAEALAEENGQLLFGFSSFRALPDTPQALLDAAAAGDAAAEAEIDDRRNNEVGRRVVEAFERRGLNVRWGGHHSARIGVTIDRWRKPLPVPPSSWLTLLRERLRRKGRDLG